MRRLLGVMILLMTIFSFESVMAEVYTYNGTNMDENSVVVIGNNNLYPVEYYDSTSGEFCGVLPDILRRISDNIGVDFTYVYATNAKMTEIIEKYEVDMVNTYMTTQNAVYLPEYVTVISYQENGVTYNAGWKFTDYADEELISLIKAEADKITVDETTALFMKHSNASPKNKIRSILFPLIFAAILLLVVFMALIIIAKIKKKRAQQNELIDSATGIGNLAYFEKHFKHFAGENNYIVYIIADSNYLELYRNESTFRGAIKYIADTLTYYAGENDLVARITENGFVYVFESADEQSAREQVEEIIEQLSVYLEKDGEKYFRAVACKMNPGASNYDLLLFNLRRNCTKLMGTDDIFMFCTEEMLLSAIEERDFFEDVEKGFKEKEFKLYLQFVFDNKTGNITSCEALSRWQKGDELLFPGRYIPAMEKSGYITGLDYYMFEAVCVQLHKWRETVFDDLSISCNFTRITISEKDFIERIVAISNKYVFDKSRLIIEITEDAIESSREVATENILKCKELGFRVALDDMGSGYTSLSNLCDYPIDILKIDRSIMTKIDSSNGKHLVQGIIALSQSIGVKVVCEGIETEEQTDFIKSTECDYVQGFNYHRPNTIEECESFYKKHKEQME